MSDQNPVSKDSYEECLRSVLTFYDVHTDLEGLIASSSRQPGPLNAADMELITEKLGFKAKTVKVPFKDLSTLAVPAILVLEQGGGIYFPDNGTSKGRFVLPGLEGQDISVKDIAKIYNGHVLILQPEDQASTIDITHMKKGHALDWFWEPMIRYWSQYTEVIFCSIFINLFALAMPLFTLNVYDRVIVNFVEDTLIVLASGVTVAIIFDFFFKMMRTHILEHIASKISSKYNFDLMERLIHIKEADIGLSVGEKANLFQELNGIKDFYASRLVPTLVDIPFFLLFTLVIYIIAPSLAIIPIVAAAIILAINIAERNLRGYINCQNYTDRGGGYNFGN